MLCEKHDETMNAVISDRIAKCFWQVSFLISRVYRCARSPSNFLFAWRELLAGGLRRLRCLSRVCEAARHEYNAVSANGNSRKLWRKIRHHCRRRRKRRLLVIHSRGRDRQRSTGTLMTAHGGPAALSDRRSSASRRSKDNATSAAGRAVDVRLTKHCSQRRSASLLEHCGPTATFATVDTAQSRFVVAFSRSNATGLIQRRNHPVGMCWRSFIPELRDVTNHCCGWSHPAYRLATGYME